MNNQPDEGPMNHIASLLELANYPKQAIISIGATRYTEFGETHFLQPNDLSIVVVYNGEKYSAEEIEKVRLILTALFVYFLLKETSPALKYRSPSSVMTFK